MNNKIIWPILIVVVILIGGGLLLANPNLISNSHQKNGTSINPINNPTPTPTADSGVEGTVTIGPTCGGPVSANPDVNCADKPYAASFLLYSKAGPGDGAEKLVTNFNSDASGHFKIKVAPGSYEIRQDDRSASPNAFPKMSPKFVVVTPDAFVHVDLKFDSGLR